MICCGPIVGVYYYFKRLIRMTYRFFLFVCLQAFCQHASSQAINSVTEPEVITETITEILDNQSAETTIQKADQLYGPCGRPIHLCDCAQKAAAVAITDGYSTVVVNQPAETICPNCGLSADLCTCGTLSEVAATETDNQDKNQTMCPKCGRLIELCICSTEDLETEEDNSPIAIVTSPVVDGTPVVCPKCGHPVELCKCSEVEATLVDESTPKSKCPHCGHPIELCVCGHHHHH